MDSKKQEETKTKRPSQSLALTTMVIEGVVFGALYHGTISREESPSKKLLNFFSLVGALLVVDGDCCKSKLSEGDFSLFSFHVCLSLFQWFQTQLEFCGPWTSKDRNNGLWLLAFLTHFRGFLHLLTKESNKSLVKKILLIFSFYLGANI